MKRRFLAFTLIEVLVVISILSILLFVSMPAFVSFFKPKKSEYFISKLADTLGYLNEASILKKKLYLFIFDRDKRVYYFEVSESGNKEGRVNDRYLKKVSFPDGIEVKKMYIYPGGEVFTGRLIVPFSPRGFIYTFKIDFLINKRRRAVLTGDMLSQKIKVSWEEE